VNLKKFKTTISQAEFFEFRLPLDIRAPCSLFWQIKIKQDRLLQSSSPTIRYPLLR